MCLAFDFGVTDHLSGNRGTELPQRRPQRVPLHQKTNSEVNSLHRTAVAAVDRRVKPEKRQSPRSTSHEVSFLPPVAVRFDLGVDDSVLVATVSVDPEEERPQGRRSGDQARQSAGGAR